MATILACGLLTAQTPIVVIVALLFVSGLSRSMEFTTISTLAFSDLDKTTMSGANTLFSMLQQIGNALAIAAAAIVLRLAALAHPDQTAVTTIDFHIAFWVIGLIGLVGIWHFRHLAADAGDVLRAPRPPAKSE